MIRLVSGLVAGLAIGWAVTGQAYRAKMHKAESIQEQAHHERNLAFSKAAQDWQSLLDAANNRPLPEPERVYIKASCVPAAGDSGLDDGASSTRAELAQANTRRLERVIADKEALYRQCSHRLKAWQELHKD